MNRIRRYMTLGRMGIHFRNKTSMLPYLPFRLWIESTNHCNLSCVMCLNKSEGILKRGYMSYPLFKKIIDEAKTSVHSVNLHHRGEALLHEDLPGMVEYCKANGIYTQLHTNGTLLTPEKSKRLITSGLDFISFSLDGYDQESYERIRVGGYYEKTVENIRGFLEIKEALKRKNPWVVVELMDLFDEKPPALHKDLHTLVKKNTVKWIVKKPHNWAGGIKLETGRNQLTTKTACTFPWYSLTVLWDGLVVTCPQDFFGKNIIGDVSRQNLGEIWNGKSMQEFRNRMKTKKFLGIKSCGACDRLERKQFFGIPTSHLMGFIRESF